MRNNNTVNRRFKTTTTLIVSSRSRLFPRSSGRRESEIKRRKMQ